MGRKDQRKAAAALLTTELGAAVDAVFNHRSEQFDGQRRIVVVGSAGSRPTVSTMCGDVAYDRFLNVYLFVRHSDGNSWTTANAEDELDDLSEQIMQVMLDTDNRDDGQGGQRWEHMSMPSQSDAEITDVDGLIYLRETITFALEEI